MSITDQLEEERRIINAATAGPWEWSEESDAPWGDCGPDLQTEWLEEDGHPALVGSAYGYDASGFTISEEDKTFIAHARTALPLRNAQVEMAWEIVELLEQSAATARAAGYGQSDATWARMQGVAFAYDDARTALRAAIEEAGA